MAQRKRLRNLLSGPSIWHIVDARNPNTARLASFVTSFDPDGLPEGVTHAARRALLDATGCAVGGASTPLVERLVESLRIQGTTGPVSTIGSAITVPPALAALVNGVAINALDYDDTYEDGTNPISHPGSSTVGAALAMAPTFPGLRLGALLAAVAVGYEVAIRVARAVQPTQERRDQVWGLGPHQVFGSASVAARLLNLDQERTVECLGLAGVHTSLPSVWTASGWLKDAVGWPTMTGVLAAHLAASSFAGPKRIFDGRRSYYASVASDRYRPEELIDGLGERWHLLDLSFKPYPACRWIHPVLDALSALSDGDGPVRPERIESIEVAGFWELEKLFQRYRPSDMVDAQFSLPYTCAQVVLGVPPGPEWFGSDRLADDAVAAMAARVSVRTDPAVEADRREDPSALRARVTLRLTDGHVLSEERRIAHGHPTDPMDDEELITKFVTLAGPHLGEADAAACATGILRAPSDALVSSVLSGVFGPRVATAIPA